METGIGEISKTLRKSSPSSSDISRTPCSTGIRVVCLTPGIESMTLRKAMADSSLTPVFIITEICRFSLK